MDETELLVFTQVLRPGYGAQLPLYAWLQWMSFNIFGINILALSLLKYTLLFSTYVCVLKIAQRTLLDQMGATIAALSLFLIPQVGWESYRTLTNTVLATFLAALTLLLILNIKDKPSTLNYLLLGVTVGMGMLSKYNYTLFLAGTIIAGMSILAFRRCLLSKKSILSVLLTLIITAPPYIWIATNLDKAAASSKKLKVLEGSTAINSLLIGLGSLVSSWIGYFWPALIMYGFLLFLTRPVRETKPDEEVHQFLKRALLASFFLCVLMVVFFKVTYFKERWMQPVLFFLPVFSMYYLNSRLNRERFYALLTLTLIPGFLAMVVFSGSVLLAGITGKENRLSPPYRALAARIQEEGFEGGFIITDDHRIGGNFRLYFKDSTVIVPGMMEVPYPVRDRTLLIWDADRSELPPKGLSAYIERSLGTDLDPTRINYVEKPLLFWKERQMRLGYYIIE